MEKGSSVFEGFYKKPVAERLMALSGFAGLTPDEAKVVGTDGNLLVCTADKMVENVIGVHCLPLGVAVNFVVNGRETVVPFAIEEPSVIAASSNAAKLARASGGFIASADEPVMIGQIQLVNVPNPKKAVASILKAQAGLVKEFNTPKMPIVAYGGGLRGIEARVLKTTRGEMVIVHLLVDCRDSMGANSVNTYAEAMAPKFEELSGGQARLKILSNLSVHRKARARAVWTKETLQESVKGAMAGEEVVERILDAYAFAEADPYRAVTHNKGIMNGISAVTVATGNDWRAVEAGAHAYASITGKYIPLTKYHKDSSGNLVGEIELPLALGMVGGTTGIHPTAKIALKMLGVKSSQELAGIIAAVGLAQNFAAMRALATVGINEGHMKLHARHIAATAGAVGTEVDLVASQMADEKSVGAARAKEILEAMRKKKK